MAIAQTSGVRAIESLNAVKADIAATSHRPWSAEVLGSLKGDALDAVVQDQDGLAARDQTAKTHAELAESFALRRDHVYGMRSRRWLYTRAQQTALDQSYQSWVVYTRSNLGTDLDGMLKSTVDDLKEKDTATLLQIDPVKT